MASVSMDNISKVIRSGLGKDKWNTEAESFIQPVKRLDTPYSVNIPMLFYYKGKVRDGWINICNVFRGTMVIGTPGGKYGAADHCISEFEITRSGTL